MKMIHVFKKRFFLGNEDIVDGAYVLSILGKTNSSRMRDDRDFESTVIWALEGDYFLAMRRIESTSLTPPTRHASI
jgi:hypothetical protein